MTLVAHIRVRLEIQVTFSVLWDGFDTSNFPVTHAVWAHWSFSLMEENFHWIQQIQRTWYIT